MNTSEGAACFSATIHLIYCVTTMCWSQMAVLGLHCYTGFPLAAERGGHTLVSVHRLFIVVASLVAEHAL